MAYRRKPTSFNCPLTSTHEQWCVCPQTYTQNKYIINTFFKMYGFLTPCLGIIWLGDCKLHEYRGHVFETPRTILVLSTQEANVQSVPLVTTKVPDCQSWLHTTDIYLHGVEDKLWVKVKQQDWIPLQYSLCPSDRVIQHHVAHTQGAMPTVSAATASLWAVLLATGLIKVPGQILQTRNAS